jgi:dTMP kinase
MVRGHFIVLEGIDGAGTTTQAAALGRELAQRGLAAHVTAEPSTGPVWAIIRQILSGRLAVHDGDALRAPSWRSMALLFAADRQDHIEAEILPNLNDGVSVICDRYLYSSVIYQSLSCTHAREEAERWIRELNRFALAPELVLFLKIDPKEALQRRRGRDRREDIFEVPDFQERLAEEYAMIEEKFPDTHIATIDSHQRREAITAACWAEIEAVRAKGALA